MESNYERSERVAELKRQSAQILKRAKDAGLKNDGLFQTTFNRYLVQLEILSVLADAIRTEDLIITKTYISGKDNKYTNPAIAEFNRTTDSANKTVSTLMKIIRELGADSSEADPLEEMLSDGD